MTTSIQASQQPHYYGSKASRLRQIWNKLTQRINPINTAEKGALSNHTNAQTLEAELDSDDSLFFASQNFIDYAAEGDEPADLALADMVPPSLALLNLPCASSPAEIENSLSLASSNSTQFSAQTFEIDADTLELEELIPQGLSALAQAPVREPRAA